MDKYLRIEGVQVDLEALSDPVNRHHIDEDAIFNHLPESKRELAYEELEKALEKYQASPQKQKITVEKSLPAPDSGVVEED